MLNYVYFLPDCKQFQGWKVHEFFTFLICYAISSSGKSVRQMIIDQFRWFILMGPAQVHPAWECCLVKDDEMQGEQVLKPFLMLFVPSSKQKILDSGQTWKVSLQGSQKQYFSLIFPDLLIKTVFAIGSFCSGYTWVHHNLPPSAYSCRLTSHYCLAINCMCL